MERTRLPVIAVVSGVAPVEDVVDEIGARRDNPPSIVRQTVFAKEALNVLLPFKPKSPVRRFRRHRLNVETLEDRLPPGDLLLSLVLGSSWLDSSPDDRASQPLSLALAAAAPSSANHHATQQSTETVKDFNATSATQPEQKIEVQSSAILPALVDTGAGESNLLPSAASTLRGVGRLFASPFGEHLHPSGVSPGGLPDMQGHLPSPGQGGTTHPNPASAGASVADVLESKSGT